MRLLTRLSRWQIIIFNNEGMARVLEHGKKDVESEPQDGWKQSE